MVMAILDDAAVKNVLGKDVLPTPWLANVQPIRTNTRAAGDTTLRVEGLVHIIVEVGGHKASAVFGVSSNLPIKMIFGTMFLTKVFQRLRRNVDKSCQGVVTQSLSSRVLITKTAYS